MCPEVAAQFDAVHARHRDKVWRFTLKRCASPQVAEEVTQEVFADYALMLSRGGRYEPKTVYTYLCRSVLNELIKEKSRFARQLAYSLDYEYDGTDDPFQLRDESPPVYAALERRERWQAIHAAVEQLSPRIRRAMQMHYFHDMSIESIASATGESYDTTKQLLYRGRKLLAGKKFRAQLWH